MRVRRIGSAAAAAGLGALLCVTAATPASATPRSWEYQALGLAAAQRTAQGAGITVAVLDSGVMKDHPAVAGRVTTGPDYFKDGLHPGDSRWGSHGTAMASDVLKVAPKAHILSVRVIDDKKEHSGLRHGPSPVAEGINYAVEHGAQIISMSLGGELFGREFNEDETDALARATQKGIPVIASAGNDAEVFNETSFPAGYPEVIAVAATQQGGNRATFSTVRTYNAVAAPGVGIVSAKNTGGYEPVSGTSPAAALTSGTVALMLSRNHQLTPAQVRAVLTKTAHHPSGGYSPLVGYGQINAAAAVRAATHPPTVAATPAKFHGNEHPAGQDGTSKTTHPSLETGMTTVGYSAAGVGLVMVLGAILISVLGRRKTRTDGAPTGPVSPVGPPPAFPGQAPPPGPPL
ncbi:S8 family peptidase [Streptomyces natalensis]|uniref:Serine protease membrane protein n=1 Tax=Streptomyces natalensis ATCC 27448 TaxID=1240678 RepID=A0A0D7CAK6_9ACTN|nr:S8 family serine peptidase [Streptomyces natalensis]KIZ13278.1 serine protease membrane protein [Streptomyces natalensis ATCC 27448]